MTYTAPGAGTFRKRGGDLDKKIVGELALIDAEIDGVKSAATTLAGRVSTAETNITTLQGNRVKYAQVSLTAGNANAFCLAWANPSAGTTIITKLIVQVAVGGGTGGALIDFGTGATATTHSDNLIDGLDANSGGSLYDNVTNKGDNGKTIGILSAGQYLTGQIMVQNAASLVAAAIIEYI